MNLYLWATDFFFRPRRCPRRRLKCFCGWDFRFVVVIFFFFLVLCCRINDVYLFNKMAKMHNFYLIKVKLRIEFNTHRDFQIRKKKRIQKEMTQQRSREIEKIEEKEMKKTKAKKKMKRPTFNQISNHTRDEFNFNYKRKAVPYVSPTTQRFLV